MTAMLDAATDPAGLEALLRSEQFERAICVRLEFESGTLRVCDRVLGFTHLGETWQGLGDLAGMTSAAGGPDNLTPVMTYALGLPAELVESSEMWRIWPLMGRPAEYAQRPAQLLCQYFRPDEAGRAVPFDRPVVWHSGLMYRPRISVRPGGGARFEIDSESIMVQKRRPPAGKLTDADQRARHAGDRGAEFVPNVVRDPLDWLNNV